MKILSIVIWQTQSLRTVVFLPEVKNALDALLKYDEGFPWVYEFEKRFSSRMGVKFAIACNSGTSGLHAALYAAGISDGDEVIIPALTVIMDAYAVLHHGGVRFCRRR